MLTKREEAVLKATNEGRSREQIAHQIGAGPVDVRRIQKKLQKKGLLPK